MLVVGAFFGRAGGIIALGLVASVGLAGATVADQLDGDQVLATPTTAAAVESSYSTRRRRDRARPDARSPTSTASTAARSSSTATSAGSR